ncbi:septum formation initiator family protein [Candidatus Daviesbacteria bacterium]|nr:septum formation initiator family protein [Candidatus Daviesbacteria bacterium]
MIKKIAVVLAIAAAIFVSYNLLLQILEAVKSGERLTQEAESLFKLEARNKQLKMKLEEIKTPDFVEKEARNKLGLARPGEVVFVIPDEKIKELLASQSAQEVKLPNPLGWLRVFFK